MTASSHLPRLDVDLRACDPADLRQYYVLDVFTRIPLQGNPAAVFPDGAGLAPERMQEVARELNLSETVFVLPPSRDGDASLRIFTPVQELPFAGHPVLGAAILLSHGRERSRVVLETGAGTVPVEVRRDETAVASGWMSQPVPSWEPFDQASELLAGLAFEPGDLPVEAYRNGPRHVLVHVADEHQLRSLDPDFRSLTRFGPIGIYCFTQANAGQWRARLFAPGMGVDEDPATGSAAGPLAVHLARNGRAGFGENGEPSTGGAGNHLV